MSPMVRVALALLVLGGFVACFTLMTVEAARAVAQLRAGRRRRAQSAPVGKELQMRAATVVSRLATRAGINAPGCSVVPLLGAPAPGRAGQAQHAAHRGSDYEVGTGGFAVTRLRKDPPTIVLAAVALTDLNESALESLVAHELGHTQLHATRAATWARYGWLAAYLAVVVPALALTILAFLRSPALAAPALTATSAVAIAFLLVHSWRTRRGERAADRFAIDLTRDLVGAADLMAAYEVRRDESAPRHRWALRLDRLGQRWFATHPDPHVRLELMRHHLALSDAPLHGRRP